MNRKGTIMRKWLGKKIAEILVISVVVIVSLAILCLGIKASNEIWSCNSDKVIQIAVPKLSFEDSIEKTIGSVVHIVNVTGGWQGSGVAIRPDLIVTARHVVEGGDSFIITDNNDVQYRATRAISSKKYDVGFIKLDKPVLVPAEFENIKDCRLGQQVYVIGSPYGKINFNSVTLGIISGLNRDWDMSNPWTGEKYGWEVAFTTDSAGHPGNSGCPVFTMDGKVRGILVGGFSPVLKCCMPCDLFLSEIEQIDLMFTLDKYEKEVVPEPDYTAEAWGY